MRVMISFSIPMEEGNEAYKSGALKKLMQQYLEEHKPEAAYFAPNEDGERGGIIVVNINDSSEMIKFAEPLFLNLNARVTFRPVMNAQDLARGMEATERVVARN